MYLAISSLYTPLHTSLFTIEVCLAERLPLPLGSTMRTLTNNDDPSRHAVFGLRLVGQPNVRDSLIWRISVGSC